MRTDLRLYLLLAFFVLVSKCSFAQITVTTPGNAQQLISKLLGDGVSVSNINFTGNPLMTGLFINQGSNNINLDSGIVLTTGRAKSEGGNIGVDANAGNIADESWGLPGDNTLAVAIGVPVSELFDAAVLEFDFVPL
ncbi:MAG: choice-of-anchor L domain-containing protein, partial [Ferruginibacter sp.]